MTIPTKGRRQIRVDDIVYAWRIRRAPTYAQAVSASPMRVAIEACGEGPRTVLVVDLKVSRPDNWIEPHRTAVTPAIVRDIITRAIAAGWRPTNAGPAMSFEYPLVDDAT